MPGTLLHGQCLCGACRFTAKETGQGGGICHCGMCRRWTGGIFLSVDCGESVNFEDNAPLGRYRGSPWGERVFCQECGTSLMWQLQEGTHQHVSIQAFDDPEQFDLKTELFIDRKPASYALSGTRKSLTEAEVSALFAPKEAPQ